MELTGPKPLIKWQYADWNNRYPGADQVTRSVDVLAEVLFGLRQHIEEVSGFVLESQGKGHSIRLAADYLPGLFAQQERLEAEIRIKQTASKFKGRFGVSRFLRGGGP